MADAAKQGPTNGGALISDLRSFFSIIRTGRTAAFAYGLMFAFVVFTAFQAFNPSANAYSPWLNNIFSSGNFSGASSSSGSFGSQFPSFISYFLPNSSSVGRNDSSPSSTSKESPSGFENRTGIVVSNVETEGLPTNRTGTHSLPSPLSVNQSSSFLFSPPKAPPTAKNQTLNGQNADKSKVHQTNQTKISVPKASVPSNQAVNSSTNSSSSGNSNQLEENKKAGQNGETSNYTVQVADKYKVHQTNQTKISVPKASVPSNQAVNSSKNSSSSGKSNHLEENKKAGQNGETSNYTVQDGGKNSDHSQVKEEKEKDDLESLKNCNFFNGKWVRDDAYPLYKPGSCSVIDEQFNCILNGRPDRNYQSLKWKPNDCSLPRLDGHRMLELLRGKRLVFVGDSLNRNMWESLVCILRNAARDRSKVFEAHGRSHFRGEVSYSFVFKDYNSSVEFFVSPFLVREWETPDKQGVKKETLRLDLVGKSSDQYKGADVIVFNTGHWWTHDKTSKGKDYYQEGSHVYGELNVIEAFRKALTTWARWVDANVDPMKSMVFFRGYSASHFSGGQWNSGGQCDSEIEPIKNETFLRPYPPKMTVLEKVMKGMKTQVTYLNITRMTDIRKDGHPSIYRKQSLSEEERRAPLTFQDCSHWCLPGVPDAWNEVLYAELLVKQYQKQQLQKKQ